VDRWDTIGVLFGCALATGLLVTAYGWQLVIAGPLLFLAARRASASPEAARPRLRLLR
jgi:hypothetical protein